jgi:hypothetical protein
MDQDLIDFMLKQRFGGVPQRPYDGQPWTFLGERGKRELLQMTLRDIGDAIVMSLRNFPGLDDVDLDALAQKILCAVEDAQAGANAEG